MRRIIIILMVVSFEAYSEDQKFDFDRKHKEASEFAKSLHDNSKAFASSFEDTKKLPNYTDNPAESHFRETDLNKENTISKVGQDPSGEVIIKSHKERSRDFDDVTNEQWFQNSLKVIEDTNDKSNKDCTKQKDPAVTKIEFDKEITKKKVVEQVLEEEFCEKHGSQQFACEKKLHLKCANSEECNNGGIVKGSIDSDMSWAYSHLTLTIGTIGVNYWKSYCQKPFDRTIEFDIKNKKEISSFRITKIGFDDYILIKVNGAVVYVGPDGGDRLEIVNYGFWKEVTTNGQDRKGCERNTNWVTGYNRPAVDIDLKPLLKEGKNKIEMRVVVYNLGHGWMEIRASQL